jgi:hypothetical protein
MSVRIHQLAKDIGFKNKALLYLLKSRGFEVKSASSVVDSITADAIREEFKYNVRASNTEAHEEPQGVDGVIASPSTLRFVRKSLFFETVGAN